MPSNWRELGNTLINICLLAVTMCGLYEFTINLVDCNFLWAAAWGMFSIKAATTLGERNHAL